MSDLVLVRHDNGTISPVSRVMAEKRGWQVVEGEATRPDGRPARPTRENGRPVKPRTTVADKAAKKTSGEKSPKEAVTPTEGAADTTLTDTKE